MFTCPIYVTHIFSRFCVNFLWVIPGDGSAEQGLTSIVRVLTDQRKFSASIRSEPL